jgi:hypothetical protein
MDNYKTKDMKDKPSKLKCVTECWAPGLGFFKVGEILSGAELVEKLNGNPNFIEITEEK